MSTREYYIKEYGLDINQLPYDLGNAIASNFIENLIVPKEEMIEKFKMYNVYKLPATKRKSRIRTPHPIVMKRKTVKVSRVFA